MTENSSDTVSGSQKRPWLAAALSLLYPGVGHLYLREWVRAALWFGLLVTAALVLFPADITPETASIDALIEMSRQLPLYAQLTMLVLTVLCMLDAYALASRHNETVSREAGEAASRCPSCGHDLEDEELDFCPWCAEPLSEE
ncbi:DUF7575 domain-containing protein [Halapricum salinum]|uniref:Zinc ribbon domain-containing protein n=1 Tax=Halapricum salinum TaxID=1457250 RepID=A0A4D6HC64_9EURY|nr:zinc ribbon domain-containing protein [Halapricum salinum]QCC50642.1 zinc ribbon domain-containing protein [Halapricum salinum]